MKKNNAIFIIGSPGSGKDVVIRDITSNYNIVEFTSLQTDEMLSNDAAFKRAKTNKQDSLLEGSSIIVTANSFDLGFIVTKTILEAVGYSTQLIVVEADLSTSYDRLQNRSNLKESLERISIGNSNKSSIIKLFDSSIIVDNSKILDLSEAREFIGNILDDLQFKSDLTLDEIAPKTSIKKKLYGIVPGPAAVVLPIIDDVQQPKKKKSKAVPDNVTDATGEQITGWTSHTEAFDEPFPYYSPMTSGGRLQKLVNTNTTADMRSDQDKERSRKVLDKIKKINFKQVTPNGIG